MSEREELLKKYTDEKYQRVYDFVPPINPDNFIKKVPLAWMWPAIDILANLGRGYNILELTIGLRKYYPDITPDDILKVLEALEVRKIVRVSGIKPGIGAIRVTRKIIVCPHCKQEVIFTINLTKLDFSKGIASLSIIHGEPPHALVIYVDKEGKIRGTEVHKEVVFVEGEG